MNDSSQAIAEVKREVQLSEWQRQIQERQEQGLTVNEAEGRVGDLMYKAPSVHRALPEPEV